MSQNRISFFFKFMFLLLIIETKLQYWITEQALKITYTGFDVKIKNNPINSVNILTFGYGKTRRFSATMISVCFAN